MICVGEGEIPMLELVDRMKEGEPYYDVRGIWFKNNGKNALK
jgi:radical SAM superfamily enzyme YgiQ (UPF0313 family)